MKLQVMVLVFVASLDMHPQIMVGLATLLHINVSWTAEARDMNGIQSSETRFRLYSTKSHKERSLERNENAISIK
jgi:hypothetical protein